MPLSSVYQRFTGTLVSSPFGADHVFYFYRKAGGYYGQFYAEIPRTATDLIDFTEVM